MVESQCPSCGAPIIIKNAASLYAVCSYCNTTCVRQDDALKEVGKAAKPVEDHSPFQVGSRGRYDGDPFEVIGRLQISFDAGFWNEWHLNYRNESWWLGEALGNLVFMKRIETEGVSLPAYADVHPGTLFSISGRNFFATDIQLGKVITGQGELPFSFESGYEAPVVDCISQNDEYVTVDYSEKPPHVFRGRYVDFQELHAENLREILGWQPPEVS